jgi:hypothetical protein
VYTHYRSVGWDGYDLENSYDMLWAHPWQLWLADEDVDEDQVLLTFALPNQSGLCGP